MHRCYQFGFEAAESPTAGSDQPWLCWRSLNRLFPRIDRAKTTLRRWGYIDNTQSVNCDCGEPQTMAHLLCCRLLDEPLKTSPLSQSGQRCAPVNGNKLCEGHERRRTATNLLLKGHDGVHTHVSLLARIRDAGRPGQEETGRQQLKTSPETTSVVPVLRLRKRGKRPGLFQILKD